MEKAITVLSRSNLDVTRGAITRMHGGLRISIFRFFGPAFATRLITQMYFPGDALLPYDPIFNSIADEKSRDRLISAFDWETTIPETALGYRFDIVLRGTDETPMEDGRKK